MQQVHAFGISLNTDDYVSHMSSKSQFPSLCTMVTPCAQVTFTDIRLVVSRVCTASSLEQTNTLSPADQQTHGTGLPLDLCDRSAIEALA